MTREEAEKLRRPPSNQLETRFPLVILGQGDYATTLDCYPGRCSQGSDNSLTTGDHHTRSGADEDARPDRVFPLLVFAASVSALLCMVGCL
jgi:hypothetical protein